MAGNIQVREALTPQERYARELDRLLAQVDRLEEAAVRRIVALLTDARRQIIATLAEVPEGAYLASYLPRLQAEVEQTMARYVERYGRQFTLDVGQFWDMGVQVVDAPLTAVGLTQVMTQLPALEPRYLDILQGYRASLITGVSDQAISRITTELQLGVLGGKTPFQIQRAIAEILRTQPDAAGVYGTIAARAEGVTRTELNRTFSLATQSRQEQMQQRVAQVFPEAKPRKQWLNAGDARVRPAHRRPALLAQRPLMDGDFTLMDEDGTVYKAKGPHDARLPARLSVRCRCRSVADIDSLMAVLG